MRTSNLRRDSLHKRSRRRSHFDMSYPTHNLTFSYLPYRSIQRGLQSISISMRSRMFPRTFIRHESHLSIFLQVFKNMMLKYKNFRRKRPQVLGYTVYTYVYLLAGKPVPLASRRATHFDTKSQSRRRLVSTQIKHERCARRRS